MTRRDYVMIERVIKKLPVGGAIKGLVIEEFAKEFLLDRPTFNIEAFRKGCQ